MHRVAGRSKKESYWHVYVRGDSFPEVTCKRRWGVRRMLEGITRKKGWQAILATSIIVTAIHLSWHAHAQEVEIDNLVLDKTVTRLGHEFYSYFASYWVVPDNIGAVNVRISEAPSARWGSLIGVYVNNELLFKTRFSQRARDVEDAALHAVQVVWERMFINEIRRQQEDGLGDLYGDGL